MLHTPKATSNMDRYVCVMLHTCTYDVAHTHGHLVLSLWSEDPGNTLRTVFAELVNGSLKQWAAPNTAAKLDLHPIKNSSQVLTLQVHDGSCQI